MQSIKLSFTLIFVLLIHFSGISSLPDEIWVPNIKVELNDASGQPIKGNVSFIVDGKTYRPKYHSEKKLYIFDSLPFQKGEIRLSSKGFESQEYVILPQTRKELVFHLGKPGAAYMVKDQFLYPYQNREGVLAIYVSELSKDSILTILKPLGCILQGVHYRGRIFEVKCMNNRNTQEVINELLKHPNIGQAGEVFGKNYVTGFFSTEFTIKFREASARDIQELVDRYNLVIINGSRNTCRVRLSEDTSNTVTEIAKKLIKEEKVEYINHRIINYEPAPTDQ